MGFHPSPRKLLVSRGALDNQRYISTLVQNAARSGKGPAYIQSRLEQKGLKADSEIVRALYQEASGGSELESARALIEKKYPRAKDDERELKRAFAALIRRGFSDDVVRKALGGRNEWPED
jgi:SOS response regulatory protein OraA/RecX